MNFNHLVEKSDLLSSCVGEKKHQYFPTSHIESGVGFVAIRFRCDRCGRLATKFMKTDEYSIHQNIIEKYGDKKWK